MKWTNTQPAEKGIYWFRGSVRGQDFSSLLVEVWPNGISNPADAIDTWWATSWWGCVYNPFGYSPISWYDWKGEWAGPIKKPE